MSRSTGMCESDEARIDPCLLWHATGEQVRAGDLAAQNR